MASIATNPETQTENRKLTASKLMFNMNTLQRESVDVDIDFTPVHSTQEFLARVGGDHSKLVDAQNEYLETVALREAKASIVSREGYYPAALIRNFVNQFREQPAFKKLADRKAQTSAILAKIAGSPVYKAALAEMATEFVDDDSTESNSTEE